MEAADARQHVVPVQHHAFVVAAVVGEPGGRAGLVFDALQGGEVARAFLEVGYVVHDLEQADDAGVCVRAGGGV